MVAFPMKCSFVISSFRFYFSVFPKSNILRELYDNGFYLYHLHHTSGKNHFILKEKKT